MDKRGMERWTPAMEEILGKQPRGSPKRILKGICKGAFVKAWKGMDCKCPEDELQESMKRCWHCVEKFSNAAEMVTCENTGAYVHLCCPRYCTH